MRSSQQFVSGETFGTFSEGAVSDLTGHISSITAGLIRSINGRCRGLKTDT